MKTLRVAVAGGGLGGLSLAQGLLRAGADVAVYERDASLATRRQGYRLHVDARAGLALQACLPPESLALFLATCGPLPRASPGVRPVARTGAGVVAAIGDYERQMREYGYAAVAASRQAEAETGARRNRLLFWLYRRLAQA